ncbi:MAG: hypothetical protein QOE55_4814 [Acidobacteriaceae bacterium]|nr:hypothetical protein [Acidobacteriaceae bacterium]
MSSYARYLIPVATFVFLTPYLPTSALAPPDGADSAACETLPPATSPNFESRLEHFIVAFCYRGAGWMHIRSDYRCTASCPMIARSAKEEDGAYRRWSQQRKAMRVEGTDRRVGGRAPGTAYRRGTRSDLAGERSIMRWKCAFLRLIQSGIHCGYEPLRVHRLGALPSRISFSRGEQCGTIYVLRDRTDFERRYVFYEVIEIGFSMNRERALYETPAQHRIGLGRA